MKSIPYGKQEITEDDINVVINTLKSDFLTQGPAISEFEKAFANYVGANYAVAVSNGTAALHLSALALNVLKGQCVITTPITFAASANCIKYCGGDVAFVDIDENTFTIDIHKIKELLSHKPKGFFSGIIPVDMAGYPVNMEELRKLADEYGLWIIEDACHAPGAYFVDSNNQKNFCGNGKYADLTVFSFHPVKHIATGEGGMITTNDEKLYQKLLMLRTHGITKDTNLLHENHGGWYYEMQDLGFNYRLTDIQAALGLSQLSKADNRLQRRKEIADIYDKAFENTEIKTPFLQDNFSHAYHLYVIQTDQRLELYNFLRTKGIYTQVHYIPVHLQPYYKNLGWKQNDFPIAENYYQKCLSIPMYPSLTIEEQTYVIEQIKSFFK